MKKKVLAIVLMAAAAICAVVGIYDYFEQKTAGLEYEQLRDEIAQIFTGSEEEERSADMEEPAVDNGGDASAAPYVSPIDFMALQERCPDAYAWIRVDGTDIDYPIVQHPTDDAYYLNHSAEGGRSSAGAIYTESLNSRDFSDPNTVIYGHNMKNGSMFRTLHHFRDREFFNTHDEILIFTPEREFRYKIFAAYRSDNRHILRSVDFSDPSAFAEYLDTIRLRKDMESFIRSETELTADSRIVTLSTCIGDSTARYLVQGVLAETDPPVS